MTKTRRAPYRPIPADAILAHSRCMETRDEGVCIVVRDARTHVELGVFPNSREGSDAATPLVVRPFLDAGMGEVVEGRFVRVPDLAAVGVELTKDGYFRKIQAKEPKP